MLLYGEVLKELTDGFFLFGVKEVVIIHDIFQVLQIRE